MTLPRRRGGQDGSATLMALLVVVAVLVSTGVGRVGTAVSRAGRVAAVADLVALAAVTAGPDRAALLAGEMGAELEDVTFRADGALEVTVSADGVRAAAAATMDPPPTPAADPPVRGGR
jgi:hypothetical protein